MLSRAQGAQRNCGGVEVSGVEVSGGVPVLSFESSSLPLPQPASTHVNPTMASNTRAWRTYLAHAHSVDSGFIKWKTREDDWKHSRHAEPETLHTAAP